MLKREIAVAWILTKDEQTVLGEKGDKKKGVYLDKLHQPGGGKEDGETLKTALVREVAEEFSL